MKSAGVVYNCLNPGKNYEDNTLLSSAAAAPLRASEFLSFQSPCIFHRCASCSSFFYGRDGRGDEALVCKLACKNSLDCYRIPSPVYLGATRFFPFIFQ